MKKILLILMLLKSILFSQETKLSYEYGLKEYTNSFSKVDGNVQTLSISQKLNNHFIVIGYQVDNVNRTHYQTKVDLANLDVEKYSAKYINQINEFFALKASYIKIIDNLAPTDQGKIYGLGGNYIINKGLNTALNVYKSDYKTFNVNEYDLSVSKRYKLDKLKLKATVIMKKIKIDGDNYGTYSFVNKDYFTSGLKVSGNYNNYITGIGAFFGKRIFTVLDDGIKVQHHAMKQDKTYMLSFGKKFKDFDIIAKYSYQNGKELPENKSDVDTKVTMLTVKYRF